MGASIIAAIEKGFLMGASIIAAIEKGFLVYNHSDCILICAFIAIMVLPQQYIAKCVFNYTFNIHLGC